jgi:hypothetical protein
MQSDKPISIRIGLNDVDTSSRVIYTPLINGVVLIKVLFGSKFIPQVDFDLTVCCGNYYNGYTFTKHQFPLIGKLDLQLVLGQFELEASKLGHLVPVTLRFSSSDGLSHISNSNTDLIRVFVCNGTLPNVPPSSPISAIDREVSAWDQSQTTRREEDYESDCGW